MIRPQSLLSILLSAIFLLTAGCAAKKASQKTPTAKPLAEEPKEMNPDAYHHFTNAVIYAEERDFEAAIKEYEVALSYEPLSYDIRMALGELYFNLGRPADALNALLPIPGKTSQTYSLLGDCYHQLRREAEAEAVYRRALEDDSTNVALNYNLGLIAVKKGKIDEAAKYFHTAAQYSGNVELYQQIAELYATAGMFDSATAYLETAAKLTAESPDLYARLAVYYHAGGKKQQSKDALLRGIKRFPENARLHGQLLETYNAEDNLDSVRIIARDLVKLESTDKVIYERIGQVLLRAELDTLAEACFRKALAIDKVSPPALFYLGRLALDRKQFDTAQTYFTSLIAVDSTIPDGWVNLAYAYEQQKQTDRSMALLEQALEHVTADRDNVQFYLAQLLVTKLKSDSAIALLKRVVAEGGDTIRALFMIGSQYERSGNFDKAVETFELLLTVDSTNAQALNYLGYMFADRNVRLDESLRMIERAVRADTANGAYLDSYAWVLYRLNRHDEALAQIKKAMNYIKDDAIVIEHLGDIQYALGNTTEARRAWQQALKIDPKNKNLKVKLEK